MIVTEFSQNQHPELNLKVTQVSQDVVYDKFSDFVQACYQLTAYKKTMNFRTLKNYYEQGLTPIQAVKKYFL